MRFSTLLLVFTFINILAAQTVIKFGAFLDEDDVVSLNVLDIAISRQNVFNTKFRLEPIIKKISPMDGFNAEQAVCEMIESGAVAIIGPKSIYISDVVASICNELNIPHLVSYHRTPDISKNPYHMFTRNVHPDTTLISNALVDVIRNYEWKRFGIIFDSDEGLIRLNGILQLFHVGHKSVSVYKFPGKDKIKQLLKDISKSMENRIIVDCSIENIAEIMKQGLDVKMMDEYMAYFITMPDGHMLNIPELKEIRSNITAIRLMTSEDVEAMNIVAQWKKNKKFYSATQSQYVEESVAPNRLKIESALIRDVVTVLASALQHKNLYQRIGEPVTRCDLVNAGEGILQYWLEGRELLQNIDNKKANGITGPIRFDRDYKTREDLYMDIIELVRHEKAFKKVAEWNAIDRLIVTRSFEELLSQKAANIQSKVFTVITRTGMPYLEIVENGTNLMGNDRYEGFVKDFMDEIARVKNFTYKLVLVPGNHHGNHDPHTGKWTGIVGEILEGRADLAICDFTITYERKTVIDFSSPFMTLGISILYAKPRKEPPGLFNFLKPLDTTVWLYVSTAFLCVSIVEFLLARITEAEWQNPHPCDENPEELENIWNIHNCIWLTVGSIMQQGCDILPKGFPTRLTAAAWWFFALIVISSYTANLAAFLTKEQMEDSIENVEDLAKDSKIKYGVVAGASTEAFFRDSNVSIYQKMWATMEHIEPSVFVDSNEEGVQRVKQSNRGYAFFMESATIDYITQRECNLTRIGSWLDSKAYGIGMPMNSPYRDDINQAILMLKEDRTVQHLKEKWWIRNNINYVNGEPVNCTKETESNLDTPDLDIEHILGVFLVLIAGIGLAILIGISEFLWNVRKVSISQKITPYDALRSELMFACKVWLTRKPVLESRESESLSSASSSAQKIETAAQR